MKKTLFMLLLNGILFLNHPQSVRADVLDNWTTNQITTNSFGINHVVYGNGIFVAVGENGDSSGYYNSTDGSHWTLAYVEPSSWGANLTYSGGHYISVRSSYSWASIANVSADGTNWITTLFSYNGAPAIDPLAATYGNNLHVVVGSTNNVACIVTSPTGVTWTYRAASLSPGGPLSSIAYGNTKFVAIGNNDGMDYTSTTGTGTWIKSSLPGGNKISYANGLFFVPLNSKTNLLSKDGTSWSLAATGLTNMMGAVTYSHGIYIGQCGLSYSGSYLATSTDGTNWFQYAKPLPNSSSVYDNADFDKSMATDGTRLIACSTLGGGIFNSYIGDSGPLAGIRFTNYPPQRIALSGLVGRNYQIQSTDALGAGSNWRTNATLQLTNTPYVWTDTTATNLARFYRGVLLP